jgi:REP element-mobilizing transposase RayT
MTYDPERHHRRSIRLPGHDYTGPATYFITACVNGREPLFGDIIAGDMHCNDFGTIVWKEWHRSGEIRAELGLAAFVVMPNHIHGLMVFEPGERPLRFEPPHPQDSSVPLRREPRSLGSFVAGFKMVCTKRINELRETPGMPVWQRGYFEHIVRTDNAFAGITNYILTNPLRWHLDRENPSHLDDDPFDTWLDDHVPGILRSDKRT